MYIAHWVDNAFAGAALEGGDKAPSSSLQPLPDRPLLPTAACPYEGQGEEPDPLNAFEMTVLAQFFPATAPIAAEPPPSYPPGANATPRA